MRHLRLGVAFGIVVILAWLPMERAHADFGGWATQGMVNNTGSCIQFSYMWGTATQTVAVNSEVSGATFSVSIDNSITNTIGRPEPTADSYSMSLALVADGATVSTASLSESTIHGAEARTITAAYTGRVDSAILTIQGIDNGFWGGFYGPTFCGPTFSWGASAVPSPSVSPTPEPSPSPAPSDTSTPVVVPSPTVEPSQSPTPSANIPSSEPSSPAPSSEPSPSPSQSASPNPSPEPTPSETATPVISPSPTPPQNNVVNGSANEGGGLTLSAPIGKIFTSVLFASYGTPNGYSLGQCHATNSIEKVAEVFLGRAIATIMAINDIFGDPCGGTYKSLAVTLIYGDDPQAVEPSPSPSPTPSPDTSTVVTPSPEPSVEPSPSPSPSPTLEPSPSPTPTPLPPVVEPPRPQPTQEPAPSTPAPTPSASPDPEPSPTPSPDVSPTPDETPTPEPSPEPSPSEPEPTPSPEPSPEPSPSPSPEPSVSPAPETPEPTPTPPAVEPSPEPSDSPQVLDAETEAIVDSAMADGKLSAAEKEVIADAIIEQFAGEAVPASALAEAGITYADLPPETPVEVRTDAEGNPIVITAEVADALQLVENAGALVGALFTDPGKALMALANIGADMSPVERKESQQVVVASVIVASIATLSIRRI